MPGYLKDQTISKVLSQRVKSWFIWRPRSKPIIFVLFVLIFNPHVLQYCSRSLSIDSSNAAGVCAKRTASSAKNSINIFILFVVKILSIFELMLANISFMKNKNIRLELGSPCFTPMFEAKKEDFSHLFLTHDFTTLYILWRALTIFELTCWASNFCHRYSQSILSKHFSKSMNAQYSFSFELSVLVIIACSKNIQSVIALFFWNPYWLCIIFSFSVDHLVSLFSKTWEYFCAMTSV